MSTLEWACALALQWQKPRLVMQPLRIFSEWDPKGTETKSAHGTAKAHHDLVTMQPDLVTFLRLLDAAIVT